MYQELLVNLRDSAQPPEIGFFKNANSTKKVLKQLSNGLFPLENSIKRRQEAGYFAEKP